RVRRPHLRAATPLKDTAHLTAGAAPTGTITFNLYGPNDSACSGTPVHTSSAAVTGNGYYTSHEYVPLTAGTYRWVADYSGDDNNHGAKTGCGDATETAVINKASPDVSSSASGTRITRGRQRGRRSARAAQSLHDTATLSNGWSPTGSITFLLYGPNDAEGSPPRTRSPRLAVAKFD
ncbi:MAG: hypothetical protein ACJ780_19755, partial [Solirubrobacteraceae bacterium]